MEDFDYLAERIEASVILLRQVKDDWPYSMELFREIYDEAAEEGFDKDTLDTFFSFFSQHFDFIVDELGPTLAFYCSVRLQLKTVIKLILATTTAPSPLAVILTNIAMSLNAIGYSVPDSIQAKGGRSRKATEQINKAIDEYKANPEAFKNKTQAKYCLAKKYGVSPDSLWKHLTKIKNCS